MGHALEEYPKMERSRILAILVSEYASVSEGAGKAAGAQ